MPEYEGCEPSSCPDCGSDKTIATERQVNHEKETLHQWCACNDCGYQWLEIIQVNIEMRFKTPDEGGSKS